MGPWTTLESAWPRGKTGGTMRTSSEASDKGVGVVSYLGPPRGLSGQRGACAQRAGIGEFPMLRPRSVSHL